ncbi:MULTISPECIES: hypothetical protein [Parabacteroides]|uniref:hypothetical protein n=1 Tax=Parabacteroides leei TaxID=2939491 RepID=UPI001896C9D6|nr:MULTISPECIES: hypothetical protein [Parabacteroides]MCL3849949.1 hypothetical protein [Parabacteroides leei]
MGSKCVTGHKSWDNLRTCFFEKYKNSILHWCGYDTVNPQTGRFAVVDENLLLCLFALLKQFGLLGKCSYKQLAKILYATFNFTNTINTICTKLKTVYQEHIYQAVIQNFIKELKKLKK